MAELAKDDDEEIDDTPLLFKCAMTSSSIEALVPLTVVPPPPPPSDAPKRKRTGHTKSTAINTKKHKAEVLEAQEKVELEAVILKASKYRKSAWPRKRQMLKP